MTIRATSATSIANRSVKSRKRGHTFLRTCASRKPVNNSSSYAIAYVCRHAGMLNESTPVARRVGWSRDLAVVGERGGVAEPASPVSRLRNEKLTVDERWPAAPRDDVVPFHIEPTPPPARVIGPRARRKTRWRLEVVRLYERI